VDVVKIVKIVIGVIAAILLSVALLIALAFVFDFEDRFDFILPFISNNAVDIDALSHGEETTAVTNTSGKDPDDPDMTVPSDTETNVTTDTVPEDTEPLTTDSVTTESDTTGSETTAPPKVDPPVTTTPVTTAPPKVDPPVTTTPVTTAPPKVDPPVTTTPVTTAPPNLSEEGSALEEILRPAQITVLRPSAPGTQTESSSEAIIDYSNITDGYLMVKYLTDPGVRLKVQVIGPFVTYTYNIFPGEWTVFPLSDGNGNYTIKVFRNVVDNRYSTVLTASFNVLLDNEFAPFLRPNQYVNYENMPLTAEVASSVVSDGTTMLEKVKAVYNYVISNISYDYAKASSVQSGYLPNLDQVISSKKGICFDYAALMTGMLRVLGVPCKLVIGYAGSEYHAWISVWSEETGWIDGAIYFNGVNWQTMDPTFAASGSADSINKISYTSKYIY